MSVYSIGVGGLKPLEIADIALERGQVYYFGASSSPSRIIIEAADDQFIHYRTRPYADDKVSRIDRRIGVDLIIRGSRTWLNSYGRLFEQRDPGNAELARIKGGLAGTPTNLVDYRDSQTVCVEISHNVPEGVDAWSLFERDHEHSLSGARTDVPILEAYMARGEAAALQEELKSHKYFEVVSISEEIV